MSALYDGEIVDAHIHLWTHAPGRYRWIDAEPANPLARSFAPDDYLCATGELKVVGAVWIEALADDPEAELAQAAALADALPMAMTAHAPLDAPDIEARLDRLTAISRRLRGVRDIVAARPGAPTLARGRDLLARPAFAHGLRALAARGLVFDLLIEPEQMPLALALADLAPDLQIVIEHAGNPDLSSPQGTALWREAMRAAAERPRISVKLSALHCRAPGASDEDLAAPILWTVAQFGVERVAFASDFPAHDRTCSLQRSYLTFRRAVSGLGAAAQRALFHDNARRIYRF